MKKKTNGFGAVIKHAKGWFITSLCLVGVFATVSLVATQNMFLSNTISTVLGGERRVLKAGDPLKYQYYDKDISDFAQFAPSVSSFDVKENGSEMSAKDKKKTALSQANLLNREIASEGFVLLKNKNNALPINLSSGKKISVFGKNSVNLVYGGSGSGGGDASSNMDLYSALEESGFEVNPVLHSFYEGKNSGSGRPDNPAIGASIYGFATGETPQDKYTSDVKSSFSDYDDAALIVISRIGGEGFDLPRTMVDKYGGKAVSGANAEDHYLELDNNEKALVDMVCNAGFKRVVMVVNCSTSMELGFIEDNDKIDAAVWVGLPGGTGIGALGDILCGKVNPSGRLIDTYARDFTKDPTYQNFGDNMTTDGNRYTQGGRGSNYYYVEYEEGVYVGYRYYETKAYDEQDFGNDDWYEENVVYPFGYGLSYTNFEWEILDKTDNAAYLEENGEIEITVRVTNKGSVAGKDVVELYYTPVYKEGGIEKPYVVLGAYEKTPLIEAGEHCDVKLTLNVRDMASYDYDDANGNGHKGYELDGGNYVLRVGKNAHQSWTDNDLCVTYSVPTGGFTYDKDACTNNPVENRFQDMSAHFGSDGKANLMTRADLRGVFATRPDASEREVDVDFIEAFTFKYDDQNGKYSSDKSYTTGMVPVDGKYIQLYEMISGNKEDGYFVDYDDARWDTILDYLTTDEMATMIGTGNFNTGKIDRIGKPRTIDPDGPAGFTNFMGDPSVHDTCFYASECVIGATWNRDLAHDMGVMVGIESLVGYTNGDGRTYSGWYAPAINIHRSPFSGRNWEYYSEDPFLTGMMGASVVEGASTKGVYTYVKHFALNDQETNRDSNGLVTWADEQTMREIYLKPFEIVVKTGKTKGIMTSFNRIGATWAGGSYELLTEVLRNEWGFRGMVISDYNISNAYMHPDQMIRAGGDLNLTQTYLPSTSGERNNSTQLAALRRATKNILYTVASSNAMNGYGEGVVYAYAMPLWQIGVICVDCAILLVIAVWGFFAVRKALKKEREESAQS